MAEPAPLERIELVLEALPDPQGVPAAVRLRDLLKYAKRRLYLCVERKRQPALPWAGFARRGGRWELVCLMKTADQAAAELEGALRPGEVGLVLPRGTTPEG